MMDHKKSIKLDSIIEAGFSNIVGLVILKNRRCSYQYDAKGYEKGAPIHVASVTKSIVSALVGIAIEQGHIKSIDDKVIDYFPNYELKRGEKILPQIQLRHLLTMTAPYKCKSEPYTKVYSSNNWTQASLDLLGGKGDIGQFKYTTIALHVLSGVIENATGKSLRQFANENLFLPLGIQVLEDISIASKDDYFAFMKEDVPQGWVIGPEGTHTAGWGLTLNAMDMVKIGDLYLNKGEHEGQQLVPEDWIEQSTRMHSMWGERSYGYLWWVIDKPSKAYAAIGDSGNIIYVSPEKNLVVAIASRFMPRAKDRIEFIERYILSTC